MSIIAYAGLPGSGKTSNVVEHQIIPALKDGRTVYHNLTLNEPALRVLAGSKGRLVAFDRETATAAEVVANAPAGALVIMDESWRYWRAGIKSASVAEEEFKFFAMHRHSVGEDGRSMDIVIVSQDLGTGVAAFIRELIETTYLSVKIMGLGVKTFYRIEVYNGCVKGQVPPKSQLLRKMMVKRNPAIFNCYQSHTLSVTGQAGLEEVSDKRAALLRSWPILAAAVAIPVLLVSVWHIWGFSSLKPKQSPRPAEHSAAGRGVGGGGLLPVVAPAAPPAPLESKTWRLVGRWTKHSWSTDKHGYRSVYPGQDFFMAQSDGGLVRVDPNNCGRDKVGNWTCFFRGEIIADWTGPPPPALNKMFAGTLSGKADSIKVEGGS